jgi:hypothetical protein
LNTETGEISMPRERNLPYYYRRDEHISSPDGALRVSLDEGRNAILISDTDGNLLASFLIEDLYDGLKQEILTSPFFLSGKTHIVTWSPFVP